MTQLEEERAAFEWWAKDHNFDLLKIGGRYASIATHSAWSAWIMRASIK